MKKEIFPESVRQQVTELENAEAALAEAKRKREPVAKQVREANLGIIVVIDKKTVAARTV